LLGDSAGFSKLTNADVVGRLQSTLKFIEINLQVEEDASLSRRQSDFGSIINFFGAVRRTSTLPAEIRLTYFVL
jgi:hypothetical protein